MKDSESTIGEDDIFVEEDETFPITIYYLVVNDESGNKVRIETSLEKKEDWKKIEGQFSQPSSQAIGEVLEQATIINHIDFRPLLRTWSLRDGVLLRFMKSWDVKSGHVDESGSPMFVPITRRTISELHYQISQLLFIEYMNRTGLSSELKAAFKDDQALRMRAKDQAMGNHIPQNMGERMKGTKVPEEMASVQMPPIQTSGFEIPPNI